MDFHRTCDGGRTTKDRNVVKRLERKGWVLVNIFQRVRSPLARPTGDIVYLL